jgi:hypothetical protein
MFTQADKGTLVLALLARRAEIKQQYLLCCEVVGTLKQVGAPEDEVAPHVRYIELHFQEIGDITLLIDKVGREL